MTRKIQLQSNRPEGVRSFVNLLASAIFWLVVAIVLPIRAIIGMFPELPPFAHWLPILFYGLAFRSFILAVRSLARVAAGGQKPASAQGRPSGGSASPAGLRGKKAVPAARHGLPTINRKPTVQRMR
jgi:hypothetical protein